MKPETVSAKATTATLNMAISFMEIDLRDRDIGRFSAVSRSKFPMFSAGSWPFIHVMRLLLAQLRSGPLDLSS
jgi:hypothetical protein